MTRGATPETADGMNMAKVDAIIEALRFERYRWTPVRRTYIPKKNGKVRALVIPTVSAYNRGTPAVLGFASCHPPVPPIARAGIGRVVRKWAGGHLYVCEGGPLGTIGLLASWTSLSAPPGETPLNVEVFVELAALVMALKK